MKNFILLFLLVTPIILVAQNQADSLINTPIIIRYEARYTSTSAAFKKITAGYNRIYSVEDGLLISEGYFKKKVSFNPRRIFNKLPFKKTIRTGLWIFYKDGKVDKLISYDKRGNKIGEVFLFPDGKVSKVKQKESKKSSWLINLNYSKNGDIINQ